MRSSRRPGHGLAAPHRVRTALLATLTALACTVGPLVIAPAASAVDLHRISGVLTGEGQGPIDAGSLALYAEDGGEFDWADSAASSADGTFVFSVPDGTYRIHAKEFAGLTYSTLREEYYQDALTLEQGIDIVVSGGDVVLDPILLDERTSVSATLRNAAGVPQSGVQVSAYEADSFHGVAYTYTGTDGRFSLPLDPGAYKFKLGNVDGPFITEWYADKLYWESATKVTVGDDDRDLGAMTVARYASITGRVTKPAGTGLSGVELTAVDSHGTAVDYATTSSSGSYAFARLAPGTYRLFAERAGYASEFYNDRATFQTADPIVVASGQTATGRDMQLAVGDPTVPRGIDILGVVRNAQGVPLSGVDVDAFDEYGEVYDSAVTDSQGRYFLTALDYGVEDTWRLRFSDGGSSTTRPEVRTRWSGNATSLATATRVVPVVGGTTYDQVLTSYAGIRGNVGVAAGLSLEYAHATVQTPGGEYVEETEVLADGTYRFTRLEPGTPYLLRFTGVGVDSTDSYVSFRTHWWRDALSVATATPVTPVEGEFTSGVDGTLDENPAPPTTPRALTDPVISGEPWEGHTLTATNGTWDAPPGTVYTATWFKGGQQVGTGWTHLVGADDRGAALRVRVTAAIDPWSVTSESAPTEVFLAPAPTSDPVVAGPAHVGSTLTGTNGTWLAPSDATYDLAWVRDGVVLGTGPTYVVQPGDAGTDFHLRVTARVGDTSVDAHSAEVSVDDRPSAVSAPVITGVAQVGRTLTATRGVWDADPATTYVTRWFRNGQHVGTGYTYVVQPDDAESQLHVQVVASLGTWGVASESDPVVVAAAPVPPLSVTRPTVAGQPVVGRTLTATPGTCGASCTHQLTWLRGRTAVGTGATYVVKLADVGGVLTVRDTATGVGGSSSRASTALRVPHLVTTTRATATRLASPKVPRKTIRIRIRVTSPGHPVAGILVVSAPGRPTRRFSFVKGVLVQDFPARSTRETFTIRFTGTTVFAPSTFKVTTRP